MNVHSSGIEDANNNSPALIPTGDYNGLPVYGGELTDDMLNTPFKCSIVTGKDDANPTTFVGTIGEFIATWCNAFEDTPTKDTSGFLFSTYTRGRQGNSATALTGRMYDFDSDWTYSIDRATRDAIASGLFTVLYHSGRALRTQIADHGEKGGKQQTFEDYLAQHGQTMAGGDALDDQARAYLRDVLGFPDSILPACFYGGETEDGVGHFFEHPPMRHKLRALTFYAAPYEITDDNRKDVLAKHARTYDPTAAARYNAENDKACKNLSRLMYRPSRITSWHHIEGAPEIRIVVGAFDSFENGVEPEKKTRAKPATKPKPQTGDAAGQALDNSDTGTSDRPWLVEGLGTLASVIVSGVAYFNFADFVLGYGEDAAENAQGGVEAVCDDGSPNPHSEDDNGARKLFAYNGGADNPRGPHGVIGCNHNGCGEESSWRKLDRMAYDANLTLRDIVNGYTSDPTAVWVALYLRGIKPEGPGVVIASPDWETNVRNVKRALVEINEPEPTLFYSTFGGAVRLKTNEAAPKLERVETQKRWRHEIESRVKYYNATQPDDDGLQSWTTRDLKRELVDRVSEDPDLGLPEVEGVSALPSFAPDGTIQTVNGYNPKLKTYLYSRVQFATPDEYPGDDLVKAAAAIIDETLCEFCPTDVDGVDELPPRIGKDPVTGLWIANPERGKSSRAVLEAMMFAPLLVDACGPQPAFAIDKYSNGEGAGALLRLMGILQTGATLRPTTLPRDEIELKKLITSVVAVGSPAVIIDNIPLGRVVESDALAAALIDRLWEDRRLGSSDIVRGHLRQQFYFSGLNLQIHPELRRRMLRVKLHSGFTKPSAERPADWFTRTAYDAWIIDNRQRINEALMTLVRAWYARGKPVPAGARKMDAYGRFSDAVQGIQSLYGRTGLLDAWFPWITSDVGTGNDDLRLEAVEMLYREFMHAEFSGKDAFERVFAEKTGGGGLSQFGGNGPAYTGKFVLPLPIKAGAPHFATASLKDYLQAVCVGIPITVEDAGGESKKVALHWSAKGRKFQIKKLE